jgi:AcrR family transcriptional regulator
MTINKPKEERISEIIAAAVEDFVEKGYEGASMEAIAARAGLSKGGLYHHFKSKDEILLAANHEYMKPILDLMARAREKADPAEGLTFYVREHLTFWKGHEKELVFTFLSLAKTLSSRTMWPLMDDYAREVIRFYESLFARGLKQGLFRPHDPGNRAMALFTALDGATGYAVMCDSLPLERMIDGFIDVFVNDIREQKEKK